MAQQLKILILLRPMVKNLAFISPQSAYLAKYLMAQYYKGRFSPKNPQKYVGNPTNIIYRSSWEISVMKYFDEHPNVLEWSSEETIIPYVSPLDNKIHRYFVDFYAKMKDRDGKITKYIIEVKPAAQTVAPEVQPYKKKPSKRYVEAVMKWGVNEAKWAAAREYCKDNGMQFTIITEKDLRLWT
jgi:hypothetical protein